MTAAKGIRHGDTRHGDRPFMPLPALGPQPLQLAPQFRRSGFAVERPDAFHDRPLVDLRRLRDVHAEKDLVDSPRNKIYTCVHISKGQLDA